MKQCLLLVALCSPLFFLGLADRDLWNSHEGRAAQDAQTILADGDWLLPRLYDGRLELQKPPLYYWLVASVGWLRGGVDAWAVRLPSAISALGCVVFVFLLGRLCARPMAGLIAAIVLATAMHFTWLARVGRVDMPLTLAVTLTLGGFHLHRHRGGIGWLVMAYLSLATAIMLKGPIGLVLPFAVMIAEKGTQLFSGVKRASSPFSSLWWGLPLVAILVLPWYLWADIATGGELSRTFLWRHNFARGFDSDGGLRAHPWWFYLPQLAFDFLPWSPLLLIAGWFALRQHRDDPDVRFGALWLLAMMLVLSCVRFKRADYLLPAYPGAALLIGCVAERWYLASRFPRRWAAGFALVVAGSVAAWIVHVEWILPAQEPMRDMRPFASEVRRHAPGRVVFFRTESHALAFHIGRPLDVLVQWHDLETWSRRPGPGCVVMPKAVYEQLPRELPGAPLEEVISNVDLAAGKHEKPLVLLRKADPHVGSGTHAASHRQRADQPRPDGP